MVSLGLNSSKMVQTWETYLPASQGMDIVSVLITNFACLKPTTMTDLTLWMAFPKPMRKPELELNWNYAQISGGNVFFGKKYVTANKSQGMTATSAACNNMQISESPKQIDACFTSLKRLQSGTDLRSVLVSKVFFKIDMIVEISKVGQVNFKETWIQSLPHFHCQHYGSGWNYAVKKTGICWVRFLGSTSFLSAQSHSWNTCLKLLYYDFSSSACVWVDLSFLLSTTYILTYTNLYGVCSSESKVIFYTYPYH